MVIGVFIQISKASRSKIKALIKLLELYISQFRQKYSNR